MSGIQISNILNLPNHDVLLEDVIIMPPIVGLGRLQGRTTGSFQTSSTDFAKANRNKNQEFFSENKVILKPKF